MIIDEGIVFGDIEGEECKKYEEIVKINENNFPDTERIK